MHAIVLNVNGRARELVVDPAASLLSVLRDELALTGTKEGCGTGYCGACTVLVDGLPVNSCLFFAVDADRRDVTTIEGIADEASPHPIQAAFVEHGALQCGFCTPGMIASTAALLAEDADPSEDQIRAALAGNLCRCTGYQSIVHAATDAAARMRDAGRERERPGRRIAMRSRA